MFDYDKEKKEVIRCNLCGGNNPAVIATSSKNDLAVTTVICRNCGLIYISPRMTKEGYDNYYRYFYRLDRNAIKGSENETDLDSNFKAAQKFGRAYAKKFGTYLGRGLTVDVGSSTGGILYGLKEIIPELALFGIEPSVAESEYARAKGIPTETALFENYREKLSGKVANVFCVQSLNHLLDPKLFLDWSHAVLQDGGHIFLAVKNFRHQVRRAGFIEAGIQIDHVYMFTPETLKLMVEAAGFEVVSLEVDENKTLWEITEQKKEGFNIHHIRLIGKKIPGHVSHGGDVIEAKSIYRKTRFVLSPFILKAYYLFWYSKRLAFFRKVLHIDGLVH